jgi:hypothetical protein
MATYARGQAEGPLPTFTKEQYDTFTNEERRELLSREYGRIPGHASESVEVTPGTENAVRMLEDS